MPYAENGVWYDEPGGYGGASGGTTTGSGVPEPYYAPPTEGEWFNPFTGPPVAGFPTPGTGGPDETGGSPTPQPPTVDPFPPTGSASDSWLGAWSPFAPFFKPGRRVRAPSPFETLVKQTLRGARDYFRSPGVEQRPLGWGEPPRPPPPPSEWAFRFRNVPAALGIGPVLGGIAAMLWPSSRIAPGTLTSTERAKLSEEAWKALEVTTGGAQKIGLPNVPAPTMYTSPLLQFPKWPTADPYIAQDRSPNPFLELGKALVRPYVPAPLRHYVDDFDMGPPAPGTIKTPAAINTQSQTAAPPAQQVLAPRSTVGKKSTRARVFQFGTLGTLALLIEANRRNRSSPSTVGVPSPVVPEITPTPTITPSLTPLATGMLSWSGGYGNASMDCNCKPRGPRRKCLERAPVKFSGGRRKGKPAGTKCLRWEAPKR